MHHLPGGVELTKHLIWVSLKNKGIRYWIILEVCYFVHLFFHSNFQIIFTVVINHLTRDRDGVALNKLGEVRWNILRFLVIPITHRIL